MKTTIAMIDTAGRGLAALGLAATLTTACGGAESPADAPAAATAPPAAPAAGPRTVDVSASQGWQDTGIALSARQTFRLRYQQGEISEQGVAIAGGEGRDFVCGDPGCCDPLPDERRGTLIGRIGGEIFVVGNGGEYTAPADGHLFLRVNDCDSGLADNTGALVVEYLP